MPETDPVALAKAYPFPAPNHSFLFRDGSATALTDYGFDRSGRIAVLASGSNRSPEQLARKYTEFEGNSDIPAEFGELHGFDSVYAGHFARYGSVPATLFPSPGTSVSLFMLWLDEKQLERMHETERAHYVFVRLQGLRFERRDGTSGPDSAWVYLAHTGGVTQAGAPVALAEIPARSRRFAAMRQEEMQSFLRGVMAPDRSLDSFILETIRDQAVRQQRIAALADLTIPTPGLNDVAPVSRGLS